MKLLIKNGHVVDPSQNINDIRDILIKDGKIFKIAKDIKDNGAETIDAGGKMVIPGIVDMHVHLREPGREDKETIFTATQSALKGGVTTVLAMPNTTPAPDSLGNVKLIKSLIKKNACANVFICGAITVGRLGKELVDIARLAQEGVVAISDDGSSVDDEEILRQALKKAKKEKIAVICHCEDASLSAKGVMNLGIMSTILGLRGAPRSAEHERVRRDVLLAQKKGTPLHIAHVSCKESVDIIAKAKKRGVAVTAETAPHYFSLNEELLLSYDTRMKVNPPLRTSEDVEAIKQGLKNGAIDVIASDHAPHTDNEKAIEFDHAEFGMIGLETELAVAVTELVETGILSWPGLVKKLSFNPSMILRIDKGTLKEGAAADIAIVDPRKQWVVRKEDFASKSRNCAFVGRTLTGVVDYTICAGKVVYKNNS